MLWAGLIRAFESSHRSEMAVAHVKGSVYMIDAIYHGVSGVLSTYVVKGERAVIIDPGPTASNPAVIEGLNHLDLGAEAVAYIAPTHIHLDHAGGSWKLLEQFPKAEFYIHPRGSMHMVDPSQLEAAARNLFGDRVEGYGEIQGVPANRLTESRDGDVLDLGEVSVQVVWTPGHASHHQSYYVPEDRVAVLGDAGGFYLPESGVIMPTTPPPFNPPKAVESLERLMALDPEVVCYGHFGFAGDGVKKLESHKRQILLWSRIVEECLSEGLELEEIYQRIREEDPMAKQVGRFSAERRERSSLINLIGFVEYFRWMKKN